MWHPNGWSGGQRKKRRGNIRWWDIFRNLVSKLMCMSLGQKIIIRFEDLAIPIPILGGNIIRRWKAMEYLGESR